jgi:hypothetical protein
MSLNIGQQTAGVINNAGGDQWIYGQQGAVVTDEGARRAVAELRDALARPEGPGLARPEGPALARPEGPALARPEGPGRAAAAQMHARVAEIDAAMQARQPDKSRVAQLLERLTRLLAAAGSLTAAGAAVIGPLQTLAGWLGALGAPILRLLPW